MSHARRFAVLVLAWAPVALIMGVIFWASGQHSPSFVTDPTADVVLKKLGHATGYALLAVSLAIGITLTVDVRRGGFGLLTADLERRTFFTAWAMATLYAVSDELHQVFVSGRTPALADVAIDSLGAAAGVALLAWVLRHRRIGRATSPPP
jgi:VanZ family protein